MLKINLLAGGPVFNWPKTISEHKVTGKWLGIDRGNLRLLKLGITPLVAIGDFDSVSDDEFKILKDSIQDIRTSPTKKDYTDTERGLSIALNEYHADQVDIYGGTGGRIDHFLVNLFMVLKPQFREFASRIRLIDRTNTITFFLPGSHQIQKEIDKKYLAFIPLTPMKLTLSDEKYCLNERLVQFPESFSSNEFIGQSASFNFDNGVLCVIQSKD